MKEQLSHARALLTRLNEASDGAARRLEVLAVRARPRELSVAATLPRWHPVRTAWQAAA